MAVVVKLPVQVVALAPPVLPVPPVPLALLALLVRVAPAPQALVVHPRARRVRPAAHPVQVVWQFRVIW